MQLLNIQEILTEMLGEYLLKCWGNTYSNAGGMPTRWALITLMFVLQFVLGMLATMFNGKCSKN